MITRWITTYQNKNNDKNCDHNGCYCSFLSQINMMLANLYRKAGQERSAVTSYKEVLRQCPVALDAIIGTPASDVQPAETLDVSQVYLHSWHM